MAFVCSQCGQRIVNGNAQKYNNKNVCQTCYQKLMQAEIKAQKAKKELYDYIKSVLGLNECPREITTAIDHLIKDGKKVKGIEATVYYYYLVLGNKYNPDQRYYFYKIINDEYLNARDFIAQQQKIKEINANFHATTPPVIVRIHEGDITKKRRKKINYKMEDL